MMPLKWSVCGGDDNIIEVKLNLAANGASAHKQHRGPQQSSPCPLALLLRNHLRVLHRPSRHLRLEDHLYRISEGPLSRPGHRLLRHERPRGWHHDLHCRLRTAQLQPHPPRGNHRYCCSHSGTTAIIISVSYEKQEFFRCGYYVRNDYD